MLDQLSWKVGGQQGEGVESTGETFAIALNRQGYYVYSFRHFSSRIKGGHSNDKVRVSLHQFRAAADYTDVLLAFDQESIDLNVGEVRSGGIVIADAKFNPTAPDHVRLFSVPLTKIAEENGSSIMKNMVSLGASASVLGLPIDIFKDVVEERFSRKGQRIVDQNMAAIQAGYTHIKELGGQDPEFALKPPTGGEKRLFMMGNDAIALGALAAGARVMPAYPITPASDVMEYLIKKFPKVGGVVVQTEDEIAAMTMTIGAAYAGTRALTATSGPGLSLMMEAIGLSGMTETPVVIVDTQRGGPSTGLPTKQEQSDMLAALFGTHGEIPKIVLNPATPEQCFYMMADAFNLAEHYQCPVIVMTDLQLSLSKQSTQMLRLDDIEIDRGSLISAQDAHADGNEEFKRYEFTDSGISPRVLPGTKGGLHHVTGVEHNETGRPNETATNRKRMMDKRFHKLAGVELPGSVQRSGDEQPDLLLVGIGATIGSIAEAADRLRADGLKVAHAHVHALLPFPVRQMEQAMQGAKQVVVIENNATGQLRRLLSFNNVHHDHVSSLLKYDGTPFLPVEIYHYCKELV